MCRQVNACANNVSEFFRTDKAILTGTSAKSLDKKWIPLEGDFIDLNPYLRVAAEEPVRHVDVVDVLLADVVAGKLREVEPVLAEVGGVALVPAA